MVGVDRRAPLGAEHQIELDRLGRLAGFDPSKRYPLGLPAGETQAGLLAAVMAERLDGERWQGEHGAAGGRFYRPDGEFLAPAARAGVDLGKDGRVDDGERLAELDGAGVQVQVAPFQAAEFAVAGAGRRRQHDPGPKPWAGGAVGGIQQHCDLLGRQCHHLGWGHRRWNGIGSDVVGDQSPGDGLGQGAVQAAVHGQDVLGGEPAWFAIPTAADGEVVVDGLDLQRRQLLERSGAEVGSDVVA